MAGAPGWVGGVLTAVQAAALGILVVITPAFAAAAAAPTTNGSATIDWMGVSTLSVRLWLLAHGVPFVVEGVPLTLVPLGLTLIIAVMLAAIARRFATKSWASWAIATGTYAGIVCLAEVLAMRGYPDIVANTVQTGLVSILIAGPAVAAGIWRAHGAEFGWVPRVSLAVRHGLRLGLATVSFVLSLSAIVAGGFTYLGRDRIAAIAETLRIDPLGGGALAFAEALYAPNITVWTTGWMTGQGFIVGEGSIYSPGQIAAEPVPALPIFGALPTLSGGWVAWAPLAIVGAAALIRLALRRRIATSLDELPAIGVAITVCAVTVALLGAAASGAIGPGTLAMVGVEVLPVAVTFAILAAVGFGLAHGALVLFGLARGRRSAPPRLAVVPDPEPASTAS